MKNKLDPITNYPNPKNIWNFRQNHPELIVEDIGRSIDNAFGGDFFTKEQFMKIRNTFTNSTRAFLLARGVNKWFAVRRDLIAYKKQKKHEIKAKLNEIVVIKEARSEAEFQSKEFYILNTRHQVAKAELRILMEVRGSLKAMCMRDRWQIWEGKRLQDMNEIKCSD